MGGNISSPRGDLGKVADIRTKNQLKPLFDAKVSNLPLAVETKKQWRTQFEVVKHSTEQGVEMEINVGKLPSIVFGTTSKRVDKVVAAKVDGWLDKTDQKHI